MGKKKKKKSWRSDVTQWRGCVPAAHWKHNQVKQRISPSIHPLLFPFVSRSYFFGNKKFRLRTTHTFFSAFFFITNAKKKKKKKICSFLIILLLFYYLFFPPCSYSYVGLASCFDCTQLLNCILESSSSRFIIIIIFFFLVIFKMKICNESICLHTWLCVRLEVCGKGTRVCTYCFSRFDFWFSVLWLTRCTHTRSCCFPHPLLSVYHLCLCILKTIFACLFLFGVF